MILYKKSILFFKPIRLKKIMFLYPVRNTKNIKIKERKWDWIL